MSKRLPPCSSCGCDVVTCYGCGQRRADVEMLCASRDELLTALKVARHWLHADLDDVLAADCRQIDDAIAKAEATHG